MSDFHKRTLDELWRLVKAIPRGKVISYGELGRCLKHPASGFMVGRWMAATPEGVPWWRVVAKDGRMPISKRSPELVSEQEKRLRAEKVRFLEEGRVDMAVSSWRP